MAVAPAVSTKAEGFKTGKCSAFAAALRVPVETQPRPTPAAVGQTQILPYTSGGFHGRRPSRPTPGGRWTRGA